MTTAMVIQGLLTLLFPAAAILGARHSKVLHTLSPVVLCYAVGILAANVPGLPIDKHVAEGLGQAMVVLAIPLVLFSADFVAWLRKAPNALGGFGLAIVAVMIVNVGTALAMHRTVPEVAKVAGMVTGVYTGGTPNMNAIGLALEVKRETFVLLNAADVLLGALYFLFLMTLGPRFFRALLRPPVDARPEDAADPFEPDGRPVGPRQVVLGLLAAFAGVALSAGAAFALTGRAEPTIIILGITTAGILGSRIRVLREMPGTYATGQYMLLVFCVAIGQLARVQELIAAMSGVLAYVAVVLVGAVAVHILLARLFRIDADTAMMTSVAAVFGPPFVGPIAGVMNNRSVVVTGMTTGVLGLALGNYLGLAIAWLVARLV